MHRGLHSFPTRRSAESLSREAGARPHEHPQAQAPRAPGGRHGPARRPRPPRGLLAGRGEQLPRLPLPDPLRPERGPRSADRRRHLRDRRHVRLRGEQLLWRRRALRVDERHDFLCRIPYGPSAGRAAPTDDVTYATAGTFVFAGNSCSGGGALYASMSGETTQPYGTTALNTFTAPGGLTISGFTLWRYEADGPSQPYGSPASNLLYSPGPPSVQGLCAQSLSCASRGTPNNTFDPSRSVSVGSLGGVTQIQWSAACGGGPGGTCPASGPLSSQYNVYAADIDLVDNTPPTVSSVTSRDC